MPTFKRVSFRPSFHKQHSVFSGNDIEIPHWFLPNETYLARAILYRQKLKMNTFVLVVGNPRTSKSWFTLRMCEELSRIMGVDFDVDKQLTFSDIKKFLVWSQGSSESIFCLDETGTTLSPEQFWDLEQRVMRRFVQVQGLRRNILFWTLPSIVFIQKRFRFLCNYAVKTLRQGCVNVYKVEVDQLLGKGYPAYRETINFKTPSKDLVEKYEAMKKEWTDKDLDTDINFLEELGKVEKRKFPYSMYLDAFENDQLDQETLRQKLIKMNFEEEDIEIIIRNQIAEKSNHIVKEDKSKLNQEDIDFFMSKLKSI